MNDPNKRIDIDKSSLLSLKAELLRKANEVNKAKAAQSVAEFVPKKFAKDSKVKKEETKDGKVTYELEDVNELAKSKKMLEKKAKYYEKMMKAGGSLNSEDHGLVLFNRKRQELMLGEEPDDSNHSSDEAGGADDYDNDEEWVDYTDCLGRTRKCLKSDLAKMQEKDLDLHKIVLARQKELEPDKAPTTPLEADNDEDEDDFGPSLDLFAQQPPPEDLGERFREQREQWDKQLEENAKKEFVHYQDVLFDEARDHGVGFYKFSTDEEERRKQHKELERIHNETLTAQKQKEDVKTTRDRLIADRVKAAKARQRARLGLPPEEEADETNEQESSKKQEDTQKNMEEEIKKQREIEEQRRADNRKKHVRPWDANKPGSRKVKLEDDDEEWRPRSERFILTQDEWNEKQRAIRDPEFAPPTSFESTKNRRRNRDDSTFAAVPPPPQLSSNTTPRYNVPPPPIPSSFNVPPPVIDDADDPFYEDRKGGLYFSSKRPQLKRRNQPEPETIQPKASTFTPTPIQNEVPSEDDDEEEIRPLPPTDLTRKKLEKRGAQIPPPVSWDYYTSENAKRQKTGPGTSKSALEDSIEAGLKFLREQSDKTVPTTKNKWATNADY